MTRELVGAGLAWLALVAIVSFERKAAPGALQGWKAITNSRVELERGRRYRACVRVPWFVPTSMVREKLAPKLLERGFADVVIVERRPSDWPDVPCHFFVEATWGRASESFDRPDAVPFAWEQANG